MIRHSVVMAALALTTILLISARVLLVTTELTAKTRPTTAVLSRAGTVPTVPTLIPPSSVHAGLALRTETVL